MPDAYPRLLLDVLSGSQSAFVRSDELNESWRIFTPLLHEMESSDSYEPLVYERGSRGPANVDHFVRNLGVQRDSRYDWKEH